MILEQLMAGLASLLTVAHLSYLTIGVCLGLVVGILPGLGGMAGLALLLPFVWGMEPGYALAMMLGLQSVTATSDTFASVLMGIPGTSSSQATTLDGFQMAKKGEAGRALSAAFSASMFGGVFGAMVLTGAVFIAEPLIMAIGFGEQLMLTLLALTMIGMLTGSSPIKGLASCALGLMLGALGAAPTTGVVRLGFGTEYLIEPLKIVILGLALFALPEIIDLLRSRGSIAREPLAKAQTLQGVRDLITHKWLALRCGIIGAVVGALPGLGGSVVDWIAYGHAVQTTKNPESYGTGDVRGVIAPEAANNAKEGGALIPTLLFGIPGSGSMAILLGGFFLIGIEPGISMVTEELDLVYLMIWSVAVANIVGALICIVFAKQVAKLTLIPYAILAPFMIAVIFFAAFQATRLWGDLLALLLVGVVAVYMKRFGWSRPAILIGFVLSDRIEETVYQTTSVYGFEVFLRPVVIVLALLVLFSFYAALRYKPNQNPIDDPVHGTRTKGLQLGFVAFLSLLPFGLIIDTWNKDALTNTYPLFTSFLGLALLAGYALRLIMSGGRSFALYDLEAGRSSSEDTVRTNEYFLLWVLGLVGVSALFGYVLGSAAFVAAFLKNRARCSWLGSLGGAIAVVIFMGALSDLLTLRYPAGLLQDFVTLPWPLQ